MKRIYIIFFIVIIGCISYIGYKSLNNNSQLLKIEEKFNDIDQKDFSNEMTDEAIIMLKDYLALHELATEDIKKISQNIKVFEEINARIIEYRQLPNLYGNSGRSSWKILQYKDNRLLVIFEENKPIDLIGFKIIETGNNIMLFTYNENHEVNHRKIQIFAYEITNNVIKGRKALNDIYLESKIWEIAEEQGLIWNKNNYSIYIESILKNGEIIIVSIDEQGNKQKLALALNEDNQYEIQ